MRNYLLAAVGSLGLIAIAMNAASAQALKPPAPGTIEVHLNGTLDVQLDAIGSSANNVNGYKLNPVGIVGFLRLYPGFDGMTENGIEYGVAAELRDSASTISNTNTGISGNSGSNSSLYIRRAYLYVGTKELGLLRAGQQDSVWWLLTTGEYYNYGDGNEWDSDGGVGNAVPNQTIPRGLFSWASALYTANKLVYLSPNIDGFQGGFGYEPNSNGFKEGINCTGGTGSCATLASAPGGAGNFRRKNTVDAAIEYTGAFRDIGYKGSVAYLFSSPIGNSDGTPIETIVSPDTGVQVYETSFKQMGITQISGQVTYAGFLLGANVKMGQVNNGYSFLYPGQRDLLFYEVTGEYNIGPITLAAQYFNDQAAGAHLPGNGVARTETDYGLDVAANYALSRHFGVYVTYLYGHRHELGYDFITGATGSSVNNNVQAQAISVGAKMTW